MTNLPIQSPAGYVPPVALTFADVNGASLPASATSPLPIAPPGNLAATSTPISGTVNDTAAHVFGPFAPQLARDIWVTITATAATGTAQLLRSTDGGVTRLGLTAAGAAWASWSFSALTGVVANEPAVTATDAAGT